MSGPAGQDAMDAIQDFLAGTNQPDTTQAHIGARASAAQALQQQRAADRAALSQQQYAQRAQIQQNQQAINQQQQSAIQNRQLPSQLGKVGRLFNQAGDAANQRLNRIGNIPTPGGIWPLIIILVLFVSFIVPVNAGLTRFQLFWLTLLGRTELATPAASGGGGSGGGFIAQQLPKSTAPKALQAPALPVEMPATTGVPTGTVTIPAVPFGLPGGGM